MSVPILYVNDFSDDIGNATAFNDLLTYHRLGYANIVHAAISITGDYDPGALDALWQSRGVNLSGRISSLKGAPYDPSGGRTWTTNLYTNNTRTLGLTGTVPDAVTAIRTAMAARTSADLVFVDSGPLKLTNAVLNSAADGASTLTGAQLFAASVKHVLVIAGRYPIDPTYGTPEFNLEVGPADASNFAANCPVPIYWMGINNGQTFIVGWRIVNTFGASDPLRVAAHDASYDDGRFAWDDLGVYAAVEGFGDFTLIRGTNVVNATTGVNTWTNSSTGPHYYLIKNKADTYYQTRIEDLLCAATSGTALSAWTGTAGVAINIT